MHSRSLLARWLGSWRTLLGRPNYNEGQAGNGVWDYCDHPWGRLPGCRLKAVVHSAVCQDHAQEPSGLMWTMPARWLVSSSRSYEQSGRTTGEYGTGLGAWYILLFATFAGDCMCWLVVGGPWDDISGDSGIATCGFSTFLQAAAGCNGVLTRSSPPTSAASAGSSTSSTHAGCFNDLPVKPWPGHCRGFIFMNRASRSVRLMLFWPFRSSSSSIARRTCSRRFLLSANSSGRCTGGRRFPLVLVLQFGMAVQPLQQFGQIVTAIRRCVGRHLGSVHRLWSTKSMPLPFAPFA